MNTSDKVRKPQRRYVEVTGLKYPCRCPRCITLRIRMAILRQRVAMMNAKRAVPGLTQREIILALLRMGLVNPTNSAPKQGRN